MGIEGKALESVILVLDQARAMEQSANSVGN